MLLKLGCKWYQAFKGTLYSLSGSFVSKDAWPACRYEGEWLQNNMEGHGVVEVDVPDVEPIPGSK